MGAMEVERDAEKARNDEQVLFNNEVVRQLKEIKREVRERSTLTATATAFTPPESVPPGSPAPTVSQGALPKPPPFQPEPIHVALLVGISLAALFVAHGKFGRQRGQREPTNVWAGKSTIG